MTEPAIEYFNMGQWPLYVGFTMSRKAFSKEMRRLNVKPAPAFIANDHSHATMHTFDDPTFSGMTCIITMEKATGKPVEQVAGLIAHEAVHIAQMLWSNIGEDKPGREAEAYLVQMITQCCLQEALKTNRVRKKAP